MINVDNLSKNIGKRIKIERVKHEISQEELAERSGLHRTTLSKIERGLEIAGVDTLVRIANALNISMNDLFNFDF